MELLLRREERNNIKYYIFGCCDGFSIYTEIFAEKYGLLEDFVVTILFDFLDEEMAEEFKIQAISRKISPEYRRAYIVHERAREAYTNKIANPNFRALVYELIFFRKQLKKMKIDSVVKRGYRRISYFALRSGHILIALKAKWKDVMQDRKFRKRMFKKYIEKRIKYFEAMCEFDKRSRKTDLQNCIWLLNILQ